MNGRGFLIFLVLICTAVAIIISWSDRQSSPKKLEKIIIENRLLDFEFEGRVQRIAATYLVDTRYSGKLQINKPIKNDYLNIFIFRYSDDLPNFLAKNCTSFPDDSAIFCDQSVFDSIPDWTILSTVNVLEYWIVGHEIAHILIGNMEVETKDIMKGSDGCGEPMEVGEFFSQCIHFDGVETFSDNFAIRGLPLVSAEDWARATSSIIDAVYFYARPESSENVIEISGNKIGDGHPEMPLRLLMLSKQLDSIFENFPSHMVDFHLNDLKIKVSANSGDPSKILFYKSFYVRDLKDELSKFESLNRSIEYFLAGEIGYSREIVAEICKAGSYEKHILENMKNMHCASIFKDLELDIELDFINECDVKRKEPADLCYAFLILAYDYCSRGDRKNALCQDSKNITSAIESFQGRPVERNYYVMRWLPTAEFNYFFEENGSEQALDWVIRANNAFLNAGEFSSAIMVSNLLYNKALAGSDDRFVLTSLGILRDTYKYARNFNMARILGENYVEKVDEIFGSLHPLRAFARQDLARIIIKYGAEFESFSTQFSVINFIVEESFFALGDYPRDSLEGPNMMLEAHNLFRSILDNTDDSEVRPALMVNSILSLNDAIYGFNIRGKCRVSLKHVGELLEMIEYPDGIDHSKYSVSGVIVPVLENSAVTNLCAENGDLKLALRNQETVIALRGGADGGNPTDFMQSVNILAYINYALGREDDARRLAEKYVQWYSKYFGRTYSPNYGTIVQGRVVKLKELLGDSSNE
ncbi:hypothetical protein [Marinobacter adhaerens]|uniref:hypothetical protein n=1 Tax=Marinobacter adhaerens TaxID=1033846 RepID=UPI001E2D12B7|nr:hypothetical protein [Marinobacter adhaerens]MCD1645746.1 hypothetical protein [Marinobacter adhaerens]